MAFRVVQTSGPDAARQRAVLSEHVTAAAAFAEAARVWQQRVRAGSGSEAVEVLVVDDQDRIVSRPDAH